MIVFLPFIWISFKAPKSSSYPVIHKKKKKVWFFIILFALFALQFIFECSRNITTRDIKLNHLMFYIITSCKPGNLDQNFNLCAFGCCLPLNSFECTLTEPRHDLCESVRLWCFFCPLLPSHFPSAACFCRNWFVSLITIGWQFMFYSSRHRPGPQLITTLAVGGVFPSWAAPVALLRYRC